MAAPKDDKATGQTNAPRQIAGSQPPAPPAAAGDALNIPTLGAKTADPSAKNTDPGYDATTENSALAQARPGNAPDAAPTIAQMQQLIESSQLSTLNAVDRMLRAAEERWARDRPAMITHQQDAISTTPDKILDMSVDSSLDSMMRSDLEMAQADPVTFADHAAMLTFLNEPIIINVAESTDPNDQMVFRLSVNGREVWIKRGENTKLPRYYVEQLFRAKPQKVQITVGRDANDNVVNRARKTSALAFPFQILHHGQQREKSVQWANKLMREG
jgi:hypothetical protein